ncbi:cell surface protein [candidate division TA06 bacterium B3_TA06]|uniref:Cell surface protein n=1 Tax=candidate division TA06 bacterium B3_TA06 TaxID=2012487 RepID=A0A532V8A4_UNCT6|nr:MAG: cell surface protein [candidate division TA06 bacterium B3_TA06]
MDLKKGDPAFKAVLLIKSITLMVGAVIGLTIMTACDLHPPTITITYPEDNSVVSGTVNITVEAEDEGDWWKIDDVEFYIDDSVYFDGNYDDVCEWNTEPLDDSTYHTIVAVAYDEADNSGADTVHVQLIKGAGELLWQFHTEYYGPSSVAIADDGTVYFGSGYFTSDDGCLYALAPDGSLKWRHATGDNVSVPIIGSDGTIYVISNDKCMAVDPGGTLKWSFEPEANLIISSPSVGADGTIYLGTDKGYLYAFEPNGNLKWSYQTGFKLSSISIGSDGTLYCSTRDTVFCAISSDTTIKWSFHNRARMTPAAIGSDGTIYIGAWNCYFYALDPSDGSVKWSYLTKDMITAPPVIGPDGTIYVGCFDESVYAFDPDGNLKWRYTLNSLISDSPAVAADGTIYVASTDEGALYALNPDGTLRWRYKTYGQTLSSPTIGHDNVVYASIDEDIYAFRSSAPLASSPWPMYRHDYKHTARAD